MNQSPYRRFSRGLFSGLSILSFFAVGYVISGNLNSAYAADDPTAASSQSSDPNLIEIPGTFKNSSGAKDAVTAKRPVEQISLDSSGQPATAQLEVDATKGVAAVKRSKESELKDFHDFHATAYCLKGRTASGQYVRPGVIAADPRVLPLGTVVHLRAGKYTGTYTVLDTGARIKGRLIDVYVPNYKDAVEFGRRQVKIKVLGRVTRNSNPAAKTATGADL
jgi:3D (Asp-Asp-Asp) domain-containing protein